MFVCVGHFVDSVFVAVPAGAEQEPSLLDDLAAFGSYVSFDAFVVHETGYETEDEAEEQEDRDDDSDFHLCIPCCVIVCRVMQADRAVLCRV